MAESLTEVSIFRSATHLFLNVQAREPLEILAGTPQDGYAALEGDHLEIFFGESGENGWYRHFAVSAGGGRFSEFAELSDWEAVTAMADDRWSAEIRIPLSLLPFAGSPSDSTSRGSVPPQSSCSSGFTRDRLFHNIDRLGRLYFLQPEPECILHGPWVCQPECSSVEIGWETAGAGAAVVEYRRKGEGEFRSAYADPVSGTIRRDRTLHRARLENLTPGCEYEYQLKMLFPELGKESPVTGNFSFRTNAGNKRDFSPSDHFRSALPDRRAAADSAHSEAETADFGILLGDMVTASPGRASIMTVFLMRCSGSGANRSSSPPAIMSFAVAERGRGSTFSRDGTDRDISLSPTPAYFSLSWMSRGITIPRCRSWRRHIATGSANGCGPSRHPGNFFMPTSGCCSVTKR